LPLVGVPADEGLAHDRDGAGEQASPGPDGVDGVIAGGYLESCMTRP